MAVSPPYLRNERGMAMLLELILIAAVLGLVGIALYQSNHQRPKDMSATIQSQLTTPGSVAEAAAKLVEQEAADDQNLSTAVDSAADEFMVADAEAAALGGSFDENSF